MKTNESGFSMGSKMIPSRKKNYEKLQGKKVEARDPKKGPTDIVDGDYEYRVPKKEERKVEEWEIEDIGWENSSYFQGRGTSHSGWDDVFVSTGANQKEALDECLNLMAESNWEIPKDLEKKVKEADDEEMWHNGLIVDIDVDGKEVKNFKIQEEGEARNYPGKEDAVEVDKKKGKIVLTCFDVNDDDLVANLLEKIEELELTGADALIKEIEKHLNGMPSEMYYHMAVYVKGEESEEEETEEPEEEIEEESVEGPQTEYAIRVKHSSDKKRVMVELEEKDPDVVIDQEGNPVTFWAKTHLSEEELLALGGVEDVVKAGG